MPALVIALVVALIAMTGGSAVYAAQGTLPGDTLYPVKTAAEQVQIVLAMTDQAKAETYLMLTEKRLTEIQEAIDSGRPPAANAASRVLAADLAQADEHLTSAAASGQDVSGFASRLGRIQSALMAAKAKAPEPAQLALTQATMAVTTGLTVASGRAAIPSTRVVNTARSASTPRQGMEGTGTPGAGLGATTGATQTATPDAGAMAPLLTATESLATDPLVPGQSYDGLLAQLDAAQSALSRGQIDAATRILDAYAGGLNALQRSGQISADNYRALYADYRDLVSSLGGTPKEAVSSARVTPPADESNPSLEAPPVLPDGTPGDDGTPRSQPTVASGRPSEAANPTEKPVDVAVPTPGGEPTDITAPRGEPANVRAPRGEQTAAPTPRGEPTQVPPTAVLTTPPEPTPHSSPTSVPPSSAPTQAPVPTSVPPTPPSRRR